MQYAAEGFDAMNIFLDGIKDGNTTREDLQKFVTDYDAPGITKEIKFDEKGDIEEDKVVIWSYEIKGGGHHGRAGDPQGVAEQSLRDLRGAVGIGS